ncbi:hypothetical protein CLU79DRAFT_698929, partial [Phycomyces nitens]
FLPWYKQLDRRSNGQFIFQEDGAPCHTSVYATLYKKKRYLNNSFNFWHAQSPDLNPITYIWAHFSQRLWNN